MTERKTSYNIFNRAYQPNTFGGIIYESDYYPNYRDNKDEGSPVAKRIAQADKFDQECLRNALLRELHKSKKKAI